MEIRQLYHLVAAIDQKSLVRAAEAVFITQPALTRSLQNLELELGVQLLLRLPRGVVATEAGEAVLVQAHLSELDDGKLGLLSFQIVEGE